MPGQTVSVRGIDSPAGVGLRAALGARTGGPSRQGGNKECGRKQGGRVAWGARVSGLGAERELRRPRPRRAGRAGGGGLRSVCACVPARRPRPSPGGAARWAGAGVFTVTWTRRWQLGRCQVIGAEEPPPQPGRKMQDGPAGP